MSVTRQNVHRRKASRHRGSMKVITVILLIVCGSIGICTWQINQKTEQYTLMEESLKQQIAEEEENQKAIEEQAEYLKSNDYIEDLAREKLGLIYDNEIIFKKQGR
ncbi:MAG: septum formation initiator family protein [Coprococcus sp.]